MELLFWGQTQVMGHYKIGEQWLNQAITSIKQSKYLKYKCINLKRTPVA